MSEEKLRSESRHQPPVEDFQKGEQESRFANGEQEGCGHIARPMCPQIDARPGYGGRNKEISPTPAPEEKRKNDRNSRIIHDVTRWKRRARPLSVARVGIADCYGLENSDKFWPRPCHLHHPHTFHLFRTTSIDEFFQTRGYICVHQQRQRDAENQRPPLETAEDQRIESRHHDKRLPDLDITQGSHEQVERRTSPRLIDKMKQTLIHEATAVRQTVGHDKKQSLLKQVAAVRAFFFLS